ncbi:short-chain dehydrogenase/reductase family 42E member 1-like isoform X2 [Paramacrobiotus metropolitanus]|uniref:short-chain dehydrogenase/reductase family 42E member 1-like isoform X2 n=1 Tax=Paramacrobiotus metropolitanus TaxID=2943436 RepID=UPI00244595E0|nr:short-chain dehydrogenase/reductase family 42E member 1-like isoform X2 [Paramacrobiotus metropolitanus]
MSFKKETQCYAIIGGGGYVGWNIAQSLVSSDPRCLVVAVDINFSQHQDCTISGQIKFIKIDVRNAGELEKCLIFWKPDTVFHVASYGMSGKEMLNKRLIEEVNVGGIKNVLAAIVKANVGSLVYTSTYNTVFGGQEIINGDEATQPFLPLHLHPDHYALTKSVSEQLVLMADRKLCRDGQTILRTCCLRLAGIYGPGEERHLPRIVDYLERGWIKFLYGEAIVDFVHIDNVVQAHTKAAEALKTDTEFVAGGNSYFISDGQPISNFQFFRPLIEGLGYSFPSVRLPLGIIFAFARISECVSGFWFFTQHRLDQYLPLLTRTEVFKTGVTHFFSIERARKDLGYEPRTPPNDLTETVNKFLLAGRQKKRFSTHASLIHFFVIFILGLIVILFFNFVLVQ